MATTSALALDQGFKSSEARLVAPARWSNDEPTVTLKLDLSDLPIPNVYNLQVEGLQKPWWRRLFGG